MSLQISTALVNEFHANIAIGIQQRDSRLGGTVQVESQRGLLGFYDRVESLATTIPAITGRGQDTVLFSTPFTRRAVSMAQYPYAELVDTQDKLEMLADPTSSYIQNAIAALNRTKDSLIITAALGTAYYGQTGTSTVALPAGQIIAVDYTEQGTAVSSNLTIGKLRQARYLLESQEAIMDGEDVYIVVTAKQKQSLLRTTEVTNADYNTVRALYDGKIDTFMGFKFIHSELLPLSSTTRTVIAYPRSALLLAVASDVVTDVGPRRDKNMSVQAYMMMMLGATRMYEQRVVSILCNESVLY